MNLLREYNRGNCYKPYNITRGETRYIVDREIMAMAVNVYIFAAAIISIHAVVSIILTICIIIITGFMQLYIIIAILTSIEYFTIFMTSVCFVIIMKRNIKKDNPDLPEFKSNMSPEIFARYKQYAAMLWVNHYGEYTDYVYSGGIWYRVNMYDREMLDSAPL